GRRSVLTGALVLGGLAFGAALLRAPAFGVLAFGVLGFGSGGRGQLVGGREVAEADRDPGAEGVPDRLPFGAELGEGPERGPAVAALPARRTGGGGRGGGVRQQRDRRRHPRLAGQLHDRVGLRRALDQHRVRLELLQGAAQRPRRAGPVVADPVD